MCCQNREHLRCTGNGTSSTGPGAVNTAGASAVCSARTPGAPQTAGVGEMHSTTGAGAAYTSGAGAMCSTTGTGAACIAATTTRGRRTSFMFAVLSCPYPLVVFRTGPRAVSPRVVRVGPSELPRSHRRYVHRLGLSVDNLREASVTDILMYSGKSPPPRI